MYTLEQIRKNLIEAITSSGLTQSEIAKKLNLSHQTVNQYVKGKSMPALDTFANLCSLLDVEADYILGLIDIEGKKTY
ncbi:MAG: helix-turn-helix domain-containing protein [Bacteroides sp.]|nr:helix-turn-helix domain-containing protein [Bacillota bacterium]MCM1394199.1 helix-turn-helix domain-containing protein [[Eubacterium] siraeum]MCM1455747.1 helix-turn-helix domain-containing protein [Bacteroides sp.]